MKFGMKIEFNVLNNFPKFGCDQLINDFAPTRTKIQLTLFACECNSGCYNLPIQSILFRHLVKVQTGSTIVFGVVSSHQHLVRGKVFWGLHLILTG